jgi:cyanate lyase
MAFTGTVENGTQCVPYCVFYQRVNEGSLHESLSIRTAHTHFFTDQENPMNRINVTEKIIAAKVSRGLKWAEVAAKVGLSKEWVTAACLGQMTLTKDQAAVVGELFDLTEEERQWLTVVPYKGSLPTAIPADPLIYRFHELVSVYGTTFKELIHEEFGDGIMSAIDFKMDLTREPDPNGDRVKITMSGKFLPYKPY